MAAVSGRSGVVKVGNTAVGNVESFNLNLSAADIPYRPLGQQWAAREYGTREGTGTITVYFDKADTNGQEALKSAFVNATKVSLVLFPEGTATTAQSYTFSAVITSAGVDVGGNDQMVMRTFNFGSDGTITIA